MSKKVDGTDNNVMQFSGDLTFATVSSLLRQCRSFISDNSDCRFDFSGVKRCDSAGLSLLLDLVKISKKTGKSIHFVQVPEQMLTLITLCGINEILPIVE